MFRRFLRPLSGKGKQADDAAAESARFYKEMEIDVLARTLWGEARGEGVQGLEAVAAVVLNRVAYAEDRAGYWWGNDIISVCQKPYQFSCWNRSDPSYLKLQQVTADDAYFATALRVARRAAAGTLSDPTGGATHYHADYVSPYWAKGHTPTVTIGRHIFYRLMEV